LSINPPSDIVLGVANAADPQKLRAAAAQLAQAARASALDDVTGAVAAQTASTAGAVSAPPAFSPQPGAQNTAPAPSAPAKENVPEAYKKFEAYLVQTFVESMLPKESDSLFGSGPAGNMWRSMLAEHLATEIAKGTAFGIAEQIASNREKREKAQKSSGVTAKETADAPSATAAAGYMSQLQSVLGEGPAPAALKPLRAGAPSVEQG
jgi:Rod binding domain-containing protein